jgi:HEAT repeat protein
MKYGSLIVLLFLGVASLSPQPPDVAGEKHATVAEAASRSENRSEVAAWAALRQGLADDDVHHRKTAIAATGTIGNEPDAVKLVADGLQDKDTQVRQTAALTLGEMKAPAAIPYLKAALDDNPEVSFTAAKALWALGDSSGREIFEQVLEGERKDAPSALHSAIKKKLTPGQMALMGTEGATGALFGPASIGITAIKEAVQDTKGDTSAPGRAESAAVLAQDQDPYALTLLEWALQDHNWAVRLAVAKALGQRGNSGSIAKLTPLLTDERRAVRYMAAASVIRLSERTGTPEAAAQ